MGEIEWVDGWMGVQDTKAGLFSLYSYQVDGPISSVHIYKLDTLFCPTFHIHDTLLCPNIGPSWDER